MQNITNEEMIKTLLRSGYLLENRVSEVFMKNNFYVESNHRYFIDAEEDKFREIDVLAVKSLANAEGVNYHISFYLHFFVECVNNPVPLILFKSHGDNEEPSTDWAYHFQNGREDVLETCSIKFVNSINQFEKEIIQEQPARQYCSFLEKKDKSTLNKWMAYHPDDLHNTLVKLSQFVKDKKKESVDRWEGVQPDFTRLEMFIPLIVLQGDIIEAGNKEPLDLNPILYYRLKTPYEKSYNKSISVDIVKEEYLQTYLDKKINGLGNMFNDLIREV